SFDTLITALPQSLIREIFFFAEKLLGKTLQTIWAPHGNSDKGHLAPFMEGLRSETCAFVYGEKMVDFLREKGALNQLERTIYIGNYRKRFADLHQDFYRKLVESKIFSNLSQKNRTILFAPTWEDAEDSSSFFSAAPLLINQLPEHFNLIIKPHPNLRWQRGGDALTLLSTLRKPNLRVIWDFPLIYPLLERIDIYLGDLSSIGYDFLSYNRPLFFFRNTKVNPSLFLFRCGTEIPESSLEQIYPFIEEHLANDQTFSSIRKEAYTYTFGRDKTSEEWQEVYHAARSSS
ncbi:MAG: CDP-glycerol glycerophosphotransferase family protein, partial [Chlamydiales bacterium]